MKNINLNNFVKIKLTNIGAKILIDANYSHYILQIDNEGYIEIQLHELIRIFGNCIKYCVTSNSLLPFEPDMKIVGYFDKNDDKTDYNINLNNFVEIKLTNTGIKILMDTYNGYYLSQMDNEGYIKIQLHELIRVFENCIKYCVTSNSLLPFEPSIKIADNKVKVNKKSH